jgi:hypothetical protein
MAVAPGFRRANGRFNLARASEVDQIFIVLRENFVVQRNFLPGTCKVEENRRISRFLVSCANSVHSAALVQASWMMSGMTPPEKRPTEKYRKRGKVRAEPRVVNSYASLA